MRPDWFAPCRRRRRSSCPIAPPSSPRSVRACLGLAILPLALVTLGSAARAGDGRGVAWRSDFASAQAEAKARNVPLWIQFTGPWCIFCRKMDATTFVEQGIVARSQGRFVPVKVRSDAHENLAAQFGITRPAGDGDPLPLRPVDPGADVGICRPV